jgi:hypothetical protein
VLLAVVRVRGECNSSAARSVDYIAVDEDHRDAEEGEVAREAVLAIPSKLCSWEWLQVAIHCSYFASSRLLKLRNSVRTSYRFHKGMACYGQSCALRLGSRFKILIFTLQCSFRV